MTIYCYLPYCYFDIYIYTSCSVMWCCNNYVETYFVNVCVFFLIIIFSMFAYALICFWLLFSWTVALPIPILDPATSGQTLRFPSNSDLWWAAFQCLLIEVIEDRIFCCSYSILHILAGYVRMIFNFGYNHHVFGSTSLLCTNYIKSWSCRFLATFLYISRTQIWVIASSRLCLNIG